jgi:plasmid maintenance system killer protein
MRVLCAIDRQWSPHPVPSSGHRSPRGNQLEALKGDLAGKHSIRINDQWRIVFRWSSAGPEDVEITDYH